MRPGNSFNNDERCVCAGYDNGEHAVGSGDGRGAPLIALLHASLGRGHQVAGPAEEPGGVGSERGQRGKLGKVVSRAAGVFTGALHRLLRLSLTGRISP